MDALAERVEIDSPFAEPLPARGFTPGQPEPQPVISRYPSGDIRESPHSLTITQGAKGQVTCEFKQYLASPADVFAAIERAKAVVKAVARDFPTSTLTNDLTVNI